MSGPATLDDAFALVRSFGPVDGCGWLVRPGVGPVVCVCDLPVTVSAAQLAHDLRAVMGPDLGGWVIVPTPCGDLSAVAS